MIAKEKNIATLIKLCVLKASGLMLGKTYSKEMAKISLSDSPIKTPIDELAKDKGLPIFLFNVMKQLILLIVALARLRSFQLKRICCFADPWRPHVEQKMYLFKFVYCNNNKLISRENLWMSALMVVQQYLGLNMNSLQR